MSFEWIELSIIGVIVILIVIFVAFYKVKKKSKKEYKTSYNFLVMGIIWIVAGLVYGLYRNTNVFDMGLFNLGSIFTISGTIGLLIEHYKKE